LKEILEMADFVKFAKMRLFLRRKPRPPRRRTLA